MEENANGFTYTYDAHRYLFDVKIPAMLSAVAIPVACLMLATGFLPPIAIVLLLVGSYTLFNTLIARTYPRVAALDDEKLALTSFGRTDVYPIREIERLQVRENGMTRNAYIRVNGGGLLRGRYFVGCGDMHDASGETAEPLYRFFLDTEARLDPENLRVLARAAEARKAAAASEGEERPDRPASRRHKRKKS